MTKQEVIQAMAEGKKVTHIYFSSEEWIKMEGNKIITEDGASMYAPEFWSYRTSDSFNDGWSVFENPVMTIERVNELRESLTEESISYGELFEIENEGKRLKIDTEMRFSSEILDEIETVLSQQKNLFTIPDHNSDKLILDTHYYGWLKAKQPEDIHAVDTKLDYLTEQGFKIGQDKLNEESHLVLKVVEDTYFRKEILNKTK